MNENEPSDSGWVLRVPRVLVIDDERPIAEAVALLLGGDCVVDVTHRPAEALRWLREGREYDLILSDVVMPEMSGLDLLWVLQAEVPWMAERVVFMTGGAPAAVKAVLEVVPNQVLDKPLDVGRLRSVVKAHISRVANRDPGVKTQSRPT